MVQEFAAPALYDFLMQNQIQIYYQNDNKEIALHINSAWISDKINIL